MVVGAEEHPPYNRPPLTKDALRNGVDLPRLAFPQRPSTDDVEWRLGTTVLAADLTRRTVALDDGDVLGYAGLVIATGVRSRRLNIGHPVRTVEDAAALRDRLVPGARVVIVGAGFIGCEIACTATLLGCRVTVVEPLQLPLISPAGALVGLEIRRRHEQRGVTFRLGRKVVATNDHSVELDDGSVLPADVVVEAVGSIANTEWLENQGLDLVDGVLCDGDMHPVTAGGARLDVVAIGDVARFPVPMFGDEPRRIEHWTMPTDTAGHAARSLIAGLTGARPDGPPFAPVPSFWSDQWGTRIQCFGLPGLGRDDVRVLEGDLADEAVVGFHRDGRLVAVVLFGMGRRMMAYRQQLVEAADLVSDVR